MGCCFDKTDKEGETEPLIDHKKNSKKDKTKPTKSTKLEFAKLEVEEFDSIFSDFAGTLNPFVTDREKLEQAVTKFKTAVESIQAVQPQATFREYVVALKTKLKDERIFIRIKNGAVEVYGVVERSIKGVEDAISAIKTILAAAEALKDMPQVVTTASGSSVQEAESSLENLEHIIRREFSGIFDICKIIRFKKNLKGNVEKLKNAPSMVKDFCQEVKVIVEEISEVLSDNDNDVDGEAAAADNDKKDDEKSQSQETKEGQDEDEAKGKDKDKDKNKGKDKGKDKDKDKDKDKNKGKDKDKDKNKGKDKDKDKEEKSTKKEKKKDYHKQLKLETVGLADIDKLFTDLGTSLNKIISTREKMQQARESFEKIIKTICNFDGKKEFKAYIKELKDKAKEGKMQIYIDTSNGEIKLDSVKGVDPPAPYRNAVKALNDIKASGKETLDLEPVVERGIESCARDITMIEPLKDFKKLVSGVKETMALPKKVKAFNENRKKVQQAPQIVKELCLYIKQIFEDIANAFKDDKTKEEEEEKEEEEKEEEEKTEEKEDNAKEEKTAGKGDEKEEIVEAAIHAPGKPTKTEQGEGNNSTVVC